jgi:hypothetical protein
MDKQITRETEREPTDYIGKLYRRLIGATVLAFDWDGEFPVFTVRLKDGTKRTISVAQDAEINGPGFISGLED